MASLLDIQIKDITPPVKPEYRVEISMKPEDFIDLTAMLKSLMQSNISIQNYDLLEHLYCRFANTTIPK